jgi:primosomal protein N' (replication factor Y)
MKAEQQNLFEMNPAPWDQDDAREQLVATLILSRGPQQPFDYRVPDRLRGQIQPGQRVRAPLGKSDRLVTAYCVRLASSMSGSPLKEVDSIIDGQSLLSPAMLRLTEWMAEHYMCSWGQVIEAVVPSGVRAQAGTRETQFVSLPNRAHARLGHIKLTPTQQRIVDYIASRTAPAPIGQVARAAGCTVGPIQTLQKKGIVEFEMRRFDSSPMEDGPAATEAHLELNCEQQQALDAIVTALDSRSHSTILMHGVTGSGKTEVYIQAIQQVLRFGRQAIVLVPEISLTPQTEARFRSRFGNVAVLHSHQTDAQRRRHWEQIAAARVSVVVGARSAVFAPTPNLGLIVLDEEHENTFKQDTAPRYNARDVALERARAEAIPLVLGSATPSLESWQRAVAGEYRLVSFAGKLAARRRGGISPRFVAAQGVRSSAAAGRYCGLARRSARSPQPRSDQPATGTRHGCRAQGGRASHPAIESPRLLDAHPVPELRPRDALPALCDRADTPCARRSGDLSLLRLSSARPYRVPRMPLCGDSLSRFGNPATGGRSQGPIFGISLPADGHRHDAEDRQPRTGTGGVSRRRGAHPGWHADDR